MGWVQIAESGTPFEFYTDDPSSYAMSGSVMSGTPSDYATTLNCEGLTRFRLTFLSYLSEDRGGAGSPSRFQYFETPDGPGEFVENQNLATIAASFMPNPVEFEARLWVYESGLGSEAKRKDTFEMLVEVWDGAPIPADGACDEIGRVSRAFVSAHNRTRVHGVHVGAGERRCVVADYNGALPAARSIARVEWRLAGDGVARISEAAIPTTRQAQVQLHARRAGRVMLRCLATLDNGEVYVQSFMVLVSPDPFADQSGAGGSLVLTAVAG